VSRLSCYLQPDLSFLRHHTPLSQWAALDLFRDFYWGLIRIRSTKQRRLGSCIGISVGSKQLYVSYLKLSVLKDNCRCASAQNFYMLQRCITCQANRSSRPTPLDCHNLRWCHLLSAKALRSWFIMSQDWPYHQFTICVIQRVPIPRSRIHFDGANGSPS
jgi:hypothetical protein